MAGLVFVTQVGPSPVISLFTLMGNIRLWHFELTHNTLSHFLQIRTGGTGGCGVSERDQ